MRLNMFIANSVKRQIYDLTSYDLVLKTGIAPPEFKHSCKYLD